MNYMVHLILYMVRTCLVSYTFRRARNTQEPKESVPWGWIE